MCGGGRADDRDGEDEEVDVEGEVRKVSMSVRFEHIPIN